ncbi:MAG: substrate-binding domain-containing protein [Chromatiales bacterium]|nr:substrate-binding domain-containing protein [Chromatiales bacterium]
MTHQNRLLKILLILPLISGMVQIVYANTTPRKELLWVGCGISKLGFMQDIAKAYEAKTGIKIRLEGGGATKGIREVSMGKSDLGGSCRLPLVLKNSDGSFNIESQERNIKIIPLGWDSLVAITHKDNKLVDGITLQQLREVLTGKVTNWKELGGEDHPINLYVRTGKISGVGVTLRQQLFDNVDQEFSKGATYLPSSGKIEKAVEVDPYGFAVSGVSSSRHRDVKLLKLNGIVANMENLSQGTYPLYRLLFLVAPHTLLERKEIVDFIGFALSPHGQIAIRKAGTLPYHQGIRLIFNGTSASYLHAISLLEEGKIYTLSGQ